MSTTGWARRDARNYVRSMYDGMRIGSVATEGDVVVIHFDAGRPNTTGLTTTGLTTTGLDATGPRRLHPVWLRDACPCAACRHAGTGRRIVEAMTIPADLVATEIVVAADHASVEIVWSDAHRSTFDVDSLRNAGVTTSVLPPRVAWGADRLGNVPAFAYDEIADDDGLSRWLEAVHVYGVGLVHGVPADRTTMNTLAGRIGPMRASNYGIDWEIEATITPQNAVDSTRSLSCHTDLPYRETPPGVQFLLSHVADVPGGSSRLVDGWAVADALRVAEPDAWQTLTEVAVPFSYLDADFDIRWEAPIIGLRPDGSYGIIRHAPGLMGSLTTDPAEFAAIHSAIHRFTTMLADPVWEVSIRLEPGDLLAIDNHRVLHGRDAFDLGGGGRRHLLGCYVDIDDLHSRLRRLRSRHS